MARASTPSYRFVYMGGHLMSQIDAQSAPVESVNLYSVRARKARLAQKLTKSGQRFLLTLCLLLLVAALIAAAVDISHIPGLVGGVGLLGLLYAIWWKGDLHPLTVSKDALSLDDRLTRSVLARLDPNSQLTPRSVWRMLEPQWQSKFILNHFLLPSDYVESMLDDDATNMQTVWQKALSLADSQQSQSVEVGHVVGGLLLTSEKLKNVFIQARLQPSDIEAAIAWLTRSISMLSEDKPDYGGIGRDWTNGYTPTLDSLGYNVSLDIERNGAHYGWLSQSEGVKAMHGAFSQGASAIALVGETGIGKTSHVYALAQLLLQSSTDTAIEHRQIISLNAANIIATTSQPGHLERIMNRLLGEAANAGHITLFLDDAQLFFSNAPGAFDAVRLLQPFVQSRAVQLVLAFTPHDYQALRARNSSFASLLTPVILREPDESTVMRILEDTTLSLEHRHNVLIAYEALREAYRLSGRYDQDVAYPGRAINLLEQSLAHAEDKIITAKSVQRAIEQSRGVTVAHADKDESDTLLNLEAKIHERMINQTRAVSVVSNALRRARAGVANPRRPIGSFLFLGPTGVGKTELAKAISATYFGAEAHMTRLDMSEYQRADDVARLLSDGSEDSASLIMSIRQQPFGVVLLDELEKAHVNILNLLLQLLDEGQLTDTTGRVASFKDCIIIATSNAGADTIRERIARGEALETFEDTLVNQLIDSGQFKPELLNRFDDIVLFRPLNTSELSQVVGLMVAEVNRTLAPQNISIELTEAATAKIVETGYDPRLGARPMRRTLQRAVENSVAQKILRGEARPGDHLTLDVPDLAP